MQFFATPLTVAHQAPLPMGFCRQEYQSRLSFPSPRNLPDPEIELMSPALAGGFFLPLRHQGSPKVAYTAYELPFNVWFYILRLHCFILPIFLSFEIIFVIYSPFSCLVENLEKKQAIFY